VAELPNSVYDEIKRYCAAGDEHVERQAYPDALASYWAAWNLLPEPKTEWEAATWILVAIGDANYLGRDYVAGCDNLSNAMRCPGAIGNPFIHFRIGQCQFELGNHERAAEELMRAYVGAGREIFDQHDAKYFQFLASRAKDLQ
jgi:tetratricopeptide (TPR) repeat protein